MMDDDGFRAGFRAGWAQWFKADGTKVDGGKTVVTTTLKVAEVTGKRHANMGSKIADIMKADPEAKAHFRRIPAPCRPGGTGPRYWFVMDEDGLRLLFDKFRNEPGQFDRDEALAPFLREMHAMEGERFVFTLRKIFHAKVVLDRHHRVRVTLPDGSPLAPVWQQRLERYHTAIVSRLERETTVLPFARPAKGVPAPETWGDVPETEAWGDLA